MARRHALLPFHRLSTWALFAICRGEMVLLHGFIRKTQQTPGTDLDLAMKRKKEFDRGKDAQ